MENKLHKRLDADVLINSGITICKVSLMGAVQSFYEIHYSPAAHGGRSLPLEWTY